MRETFQRFYLSKLLRSGEAVFVPVDYGAAKLPVLTIILLYAVFLKYQHIVMLTFVNTLKRFLRFATYCFLSISTFYAVFLKCQHIVMLTFVNTDNKFSNVCCLLLFIYEYSIR